MNKNYYKLRLTSLSDGGQDLKVLIMHPMENGSRRDMQSGNVIAADYITDIEFTVDNEPYIKFYLGENVAKNPFIAFHLPTALSDGQVIRIHWRENNNHLTTYQCVIQLDSDGNFSAAGDQYASKVQKLSWHSKPACKNRLAPGLTP